MSDVNDNSGYSREDWQKHYDNDDLRWDIGQVSPPFVWLLEEGILRQGSMLIPGCGAGHEATFFAKMGYDVTGVDFADGAVKRLTRSLRRAEVEAKVLCMDFFHLPEKYDNSFDWILEQTFFCAIHPGKRKAYAEITRRVLRTGGKLAALFYETGEEGGPPFNTHPEEVREIFFPGFEIERLEKTPHSIERRQNKEWLGILVKK